MSIRIAPFAAAVLALGGVFVGAAVATPARAADPADPESIIKAALAGYDLPGATVAIVSPEGTETFGLGYADLEVGTPVDPNQTVFPLDSISKTVTAATVMSLVAEGVLDLNADVAEHLPADVADGLPDDDLITLRHLLTHTAGFEEQIIGLMPAPGAAVEPLAEHLAEHLPAVVREPGSTVAYSNYGFALAGLVAQEASGTDFDRLASERVFEPLGMGSSSIAAQRPAPLTERFTEIYLHDGESSVLTERGDDLLYPAGGGVATAADMGRYMAFHLGDGAPLLPEGAAAELYGTQFQSDPRLPGVALGFYEAYHGSTRMLTHGGDGPGSHSLMTLVPDADVGVFIAVNGDGAGEGGAAAVQDATEDLLDAMLGASGEADGPVGAASPENAVDAVSGTFHSTRMNDSDYSRLLAAVGSDVTVEVEEDGSVTTTNLPAGDGPWHPVGDGLYRAEDGVLIAFGEVDGQVMLYPGETEAYERVPWYRETNVFLAVAAAGLLLLASAFAWPVAALVRRVRGRRLAAPAGARFATVAATMTGVLAFGFTAALVLLIADTNQFVVSVLAGSAPVPLVSIAALLAGAGAVVTGVCAVTAVARRWWGAARRVHFALVALGALAFAAVVHYYHFTTAPLLLL